MATTAQPDPATTSDNSARPTQAFAWGVETYDTPLKAMTIERRALRNDDVAIRITHCGICHSDLHMARNDWGMSLYPMVPGHEIVGIVTGVGPDVTKYREGDRVAVGCLVDSCQECRQCQSGHEQFCEKGATLTYSGLDRRDGSLTQGGYSDHIVTRQEFVLRLPDSLDLSKAAPLLCAGITTYSPLRKFGVGPGQKVGVAGLGGLGHMGVKFAHALGAHVTMITTSPGKGDDARALGADEVLISKDPDAMSAAAGTFDFILDTIPVGHDVNPYLNLLAPNGNMVLVGAIEALPSVHGGLLAMRNRTLAGSLIGGLQETQEMLDFCGENGILPDIETIRIDEVNGAYDRLVRGDVRYRFVIDMEASRPA
jgi:alcohol dehydrogenase (NADP+)